MDATQAAQLRAPFPPEAIGKLPKGGAMLDFVGHAATTDRLLQVDPEWTWEPFAVDADGLPLVKGGGLWIRLTICGVTRPGFGDGTSTKEMIGDAIRNAAMRFGVALDLWTKEDLHAAKPVPLVSQAEADELRAILNAATADDRKAFMARFGCKPGDLPALELGKARDWLSDLEYLVVAS